MLHILLCYGLSLVVNTIIILDAYSDEDVEVEWEMIHEIVGPNGTREGGVPGVFLADRADDEGFYIFIHNIKSTQYQPKIGVDGEPHLSITVGGRPQAVTKETTELVLTLFWIDHAL